MLADLADGRIEACLDACHDIDTATLQQLGEGSFGLLRDRLTRYQEFAHRLHGVLTSIHERGGQQTSLDSALLMELLALCAAQSLNAVTASAQAHAADAIAEAVELDMADWWTATGTSYLAQVPKARIADAVTEAVSSEAALSLAKLKKGEAVVKAEALLAGTRWLPAPLRVR